MPERPPFGNATPSSVMRGIARATRAAVGEPRAPRRWSGSPSNPDTLVTPGPPTAGSKSISRSTPSNHARMFERYRAMKGEAR